MASRTRRATALRTAAPAEAAGSGPRAVLLQDLARVHLEATKLYAAGRYAEAAEVMASICVGSAALGPDDPFHLDRQAELAAFRHLAGEYDEAHALYAHVVARRRAGGVRDANFARLLGNYAELCRETDRFEQAEEVTGEAVDIYKATIGPRHPEYAGALEKLALLYRQTGRVPGAARLLRRALRIKRAAPGIGPQPLSAVLSALSAVLYDQDRYAAALQASEEALRYARLAFGERHPKVAQVVANQAAILFAMGTMGRAETAARDALARFRVALGDRYPDTANAMNTLARILHLRSGLAEAEALYLEALEVYRAAGAADRSQARAVLNHLAQLRLLQGRHAEAEAIYDTILEAEEREMGPWHPGLALLLNNRAQLALVAGQYAVARRLCERALAIRRRAGGEGHPDYASNLANLAAIYQDVGDLGRALRLTLGALAVERRVLGERHPDVALTLVKLGSLYAERREFARAAATYEEALEIHRAAGASTGTNAAQVLNNLAVLHIETGDYEAAEALIRRALRLRRARLGPAHPDVGESLLNFSTAEHDQGRFSRSASLARRALAVLEPALGRTHPRVARCRRGIAFSLAALGRHRAALRVAVEGEEAFDATLHSVLGAASERQRLTYLDAIRRQHDAFLSVALLPRQGGAGARAAADVVLRRKGVTAEVLTAQRAHARGGDGDVAAGLGRLTVLRLRIARRTLDGPGAEGAAAHRRLLAELEEARDQLEGELAAHVPELRLEQLLRAAGRTAVAGALPRGSALVEIVQYSPIRFDARPARGEPQVGERRYVALVMHAGAPDGVRAVDLELAAPLDALVARFRVGLAGGRELGPQSDDDPGATQDAGSALYASVLAPLLRALRGRTRLFVAPDGMLSLLPWDALPHPGGKRVIDRFRITYVTTGRDLLRMAGEPRGRPGPAVVIAAPDYDLPAPHGRRPGKARAAPGGPRRSVLRRAGLRFAPLDGARKEGRSVAALLGVAPWLGARALKGRVKELRSPGVLHLATHGFFLPDPRRGAGGASAPDASVRLSRAGNPLLRSGLALAGANRWLDGLPLPPEAGDGLLTAEDVAALDLHSTELVVLSACETGVGSTRVGEGVFGLRRAFVVAGARTLVTSLWSVPDAQTRELMEHFYRRIGEGAPRGEALWEAQLSVRARHPDPWFWGAFICQGDAGPLPAGLRRVRHG